MIARSLLLIDQSKPLETSSQLHLIIRSRQLPSINHPRKSASPPPLPSFVPFLPHTLFYPCSSCSPKRSLLHRQDPRALAVLRNVTGNSCALDQVTSPGSFHFSRGNEAVVRSSFSVADQRCTLRKKDGCLDGGRNECRKDA